jgi:hypothetical protein
VEQIYVTTQDGRTQIAGLVQLDPVLYALDNRYYRVAGPIAMGYQEAEKLREA